MREKIVVILICIILLATIFLSGCNGIKGSVTTGEWIHNNTAATSVIFSGYITDIYHYGDEYDAYFYYDNKDNGPNYNDYPYFCGPVTPTRITKLFSCNAYNLDRTET